MKKIIVYIGSPGSGKGTQAALLHQQLEIPHISTGEILREHVRKKTTLGQTVSAYLNQGLLVPDPLILDMLFDRVAEKDCEKGYILDGFPRTLAQAQALQLRLDNLHPKVFNLMLSDANILQRLTLRRVCPSCHTLYHLTYSPPQVEGVCDQCSTPLIHRSDDTEEVIVNRLKIYHAQTAPLIDYYQQLGLLHPIDCADSKSAIFAAIQQHLSTPLPS